MSEPNPRAAFNAEMERTAFNKKAVSRAPQAEIFAFAKEWFQARGYRVMPSGRPNQIFVMGGAEGSLPRVNGDILAVSNVGKGKVTMLTFNSVGETLSSYMAEFVEVLRAQAKAARREPTAEEKAASG
ncbi:MAG TPA: hypothetical protein VD789_06700 [Thermomicrobiales bacterium]|nr:hypothetical protein [Thermomicrobiales bacterium]